MASGFYAEQSGAAMPKTTLPDLQRAVTTPHGDRCFSRLSSKNPEKFGKGEIEGVVAPETAALSVVRVFETASGVI